MFPYIFPVVTKCSVWHGFDFKGDDFSYQPDVKTAADCNIICQQNPECKYWSWLTHESTGAPYKYIIIDNFHLNGPIPFKKKLN